MAWWRCISKSLTSLRNSGFVNKNLLTRYRASNKVGKSVKLCLFVGYVLSFLQMRPVAKKGYSRVSGSFVNQSGCKGKDGYSCQAS